MISQLLCCRCAVRAPGLSVCPVCLSQRLQKLPTHLVETAGHSQRRSKRFPEIPGYLQTLPEATRYSQTHPEITGASRRFPDAPRETPRGSSRDSQRLFERFLEIPGDSQRPPEIRRETSRDSRTPTETPGESCRLPEAPRHSRDSQTLQEASQTFPEIPGDSQTLPATPRDSWRIPEILGDSQKLFGRLKVLRGAPTHTHPDIPRDSTKAFRETPGDP